MRTMFPSELADLYDTIVDGHDKYDRNLTVVEVRELFRVNNPTATRAKRELLAEILDDISAYAPIGEDVAQDVLTKMWQQEVGRRIADMGLAMMEGNPEKIHEIKELIERSEDGFVPEDEDDAPISTDLDELLEYDSLANCWEFNIPSLSRAVRGGRAGEFMIAFARPEVGKTAFYVSLAVAPNGFCAQGADVHIITNEEPAKRTMIRAMSAYTGFSKEQLYMHREQAKQKFTEKGEQS